MGTAIVLLLDDDALEAARTVLQLVPTIAYPSQLHVKLLSYGSPSTRCDSLSQSSPFGPFSGCIVIIIMAAQRNDACVSTSGSDGAIGTFYNMMPKTFVALRAAFNRGDTAEALRMQTRGNRVIALALDGGVGKLSVLASMRHYMREAQGIAAAGYSKKVTRGDVYTDLIHGAAFTTAVQQLGFPIE
jgi:hypothetical protein